MSLKSLGGKCWDILLLTFHNVLGQTGSAGKYECPVKVENFLAVTLSSNWQCQYGIYINHSTCL